MIYALKYFEIFVYDSVLELWGLLIWRRQVWEDQRHNLPQNYLAFHDIPASSLNKIDSLPIFRGENNAHHIAIVCCMLDLWDSLWTFHEDWISEAECSCDLRLFKSPLNWGGTHLSECTTLELSTRCIHRVNYSHIQAWCMSLLIYYSCIADICSSVNYAWYMPG